MSKFITKANNEFSFSKCTTSGEVSRQARKNITRFGYTSIPLDVVNETKFNFQDFAKSVGLDYVVGSLDVGILKLQSDLIFGEPPPKKKRKKKVS